jgi:hypothetical protein
VLAALGEVGRRSDELSEHYQAECRRVLRDLRSASRLRAFVGELLSFQQKMQLGNDWWSNADSRTRIEELFARHVADEDDVAIELAALVLECQDLLGAQDRGLLTGVGVAPEDAKRAVAELDVGIPIRSGMFDRVLHSSLAEEQKDLARGAFNVAATNVIGNVLHEGARANGFITAKEGSWSDFVQQGAIDLMVGGFLDWALDPTDDIVAELSYQLEAVETDLLEGPAGLLPLLQQMNEAHQAARRKWLLSNTY